jgi:hypothetical protein
VGDVVFLTPGLKNPPADGAPPTGAADAAGEKPPAAANADVADATSPAAANATVANAANAGDGAPKTLAGKLSLGSEAGKTLEDLFLDPDIPFRATLSLKKNPDFPFPPGAPELLGDNLTLDLEMARKDEKLAGNLAVDSEKIGLRLDPLELDLDSRVIAAETKGTIVLKNPADLANFVKGEPGEQNFADWLKDRNGEKPEGEKGSGEAKGPAAANESPATASSGSAPETDAAAEPLSGEAKEAKASIPFPETLALNLDFSAEKDGDLLRLNKLALSGKGMDLSLLGTYATDPGKARVVLNLTVDGTSGFSKFLSVLGSFPGENMGLDLRLAGDYELESMRTERLTADARVDDLASFLPHASGEASAVATVSGSLPEKMDLDLTAEAEWLGIVGEPGDPLPLTITGAKLKLNAEASDLLGKPRFAGVLDFAAKSGGGASGNGAAGSGESENATEDAKLNADFAFATGLGEGKDGSAVPAVEAKKLFLSILGHDLRGTGLKATFGEGAIPVLEGDLSLAVNDYDLENKILGKKMEGSPIVADFNFGVGKDGEEIYSAVLDCENFSAEKVLSLKGTKLRAVVRNPRGENPIFDLSLEEGPGKAGPVDWKSGKVAIDNSGHGASPGAAGRGGPGGPIEIRAEFLKASGKELLRLVGRYNPPGAVAELSELSLSPPGLNETLKLARPATLREREGKDGEKTLTLDGFDVSLGKTALAVKGDLLPLNIEAELTDLPFSLLKQLGLESAPDGRANVSAKYDEKGFGDFRVESGIELPGDAGQKLRFAVDLWGKLENHKTLSGEASVTLPGPGNEDPVKLTYALATRKAGKFFEPDPEGPVKAELNWIGDAARLWFFAGQSDRTLRGNMEVSAKLAGSLSSPAPEAAVYLSKAVFEDRILGIFLNSIDLEARMTEKGEGLKILLDASDGGTGEIALAGDLDLAGDPPKLDVRGQIKHLAPLQRDDFNLTLSGLITIAGPVASPRISAKTLVETAELSLAKTLGGPSVQTLNIDGEETAVRKGPELDVSIEIPGETFVRGMGLDSEWKGSVRIGGTTDTPLISGHLNPVRGYFTFLGKDFTFTGGEITFRNLTKLDPGLNIELTRSVPDLTAILKVGGTLNKPEISFASTPPYPRDEVLAHVLFNKGASQLSRFEALQLANNLRELSGLGGGGLNPLVRMRESLGLSVLRIGESAGTDDRHLEGNSFRKNLGLDGDGGESEDSGGSTLEAGKYINDKVYVGVEQNLASNTTGVRVEVELSPKLNLVARSTPTSSRIALGWKHDY